jgi:glycosyltransferase involved in cell wall biosynthesis
LSKILYLGPFDPLLCDGVSRSMYELLEFFANEGHETFITTVMHESHLTRQCLSYLKAICRQHSERNDEVDRFQGNLGGVFVDYQILPLSRTAVLGLAPQALKQAVEKLKGYGGCYVFTCDADLTSLTATFLVGVRGAHFFHSPPYVKIFSGDSQRRLLKGRRIFAASDFTREQIRRKLDLDSVVWHPFIRPYEPGELPFSVEKREAVGFYSAGWHKGDEMVAQLIGAMPNRRFVVMGREFSGVLKGVEFPNLVYLGDVHDAEQFFSRAKMVIVPSMGKEGFSRIIVEAAMRGIPAIANQVGGIPEALADSGILIPVNNDADIESHAVAEKYREQIEKLFMSDDLHHSLSQKALHRGMSYAKAQRQEALRIYHEYNAPT